MFKKFIRKIKEYFQIEPIIENPFGRKTIGGKITMNSKRERLEYRINNIILNMAPKTIKIERDSNFELDLGFDSLDFVEFIFMIEEDFSVELPDEETEKINNVGDIYDLVDKKLKEMNNG